MEVEITYNYNNMVYTIIGPEELHQQLQSDARVFEEYINTHIASLEMQAPNICSQDGDSFVWTTKKVLLFLDEIEKIKVDLRNPKLKKRELWKKIKDAMFNKGINNITEEIVERKFRNMKTTFKHIKDNKKKTSTGRGEIRWEYYDIMDRIFEDDKTVNIGHTVSSINDENPDFSAQDLVRSHAEPTEEREDNEEILSPSNKTKSGTLKLRQKAEKGRQLYGMRKKQLDIEETRLQELSLLRKAIEENNRMQAERNELLKALLSQQQK